MKKWILFNLNHPIFVLIALAIITVPLAAGLMRLEFDSSVEALMPEQDKDYRLGQLAKQAFGDNKTFTIISIEPIRSTKLTTDVFRFLEPLVLELKEYKDFNREIEIMRMKSILEATGVTIATETPKAPSAKMKSTATKKTTDEMDGQFLDHEKKPDKKMTPSSQQKEQIKDTTEYSKEKNGNHDLSYSSWKQDLILSQESRSHRYVTLERARNKFDYSKLRQASLKSIQSALDAGGNLMLQTILAYHKLAQVPLEKIFSRDQIRKIVESWEDLYLFKSQKIIKNLMDPITIEDIQAQDNELRPSSILKKSEAGNYIFPQNDAEFISYIQKMSRNPLYENSLYKKNSQGDIIAFGVNFVLQAQENHTIIREYLWHLIQKYNHEPYQIHTMGTMIFNKFMNDFTRRDLTFFLPLVILIVIITFFFNFRSVRGTILPTLAVILATVWTMGIMGYTKIPLTIIGSIIPTLLIAVASSYSIHIFNQFLQDQHLISADHKKTALFTTLNHISVTVTLAGLTTFVGFITLGVNQVRALREFGLFAALGTLFAVIISVALMSAALMILPTPGSRKKKFTTKSNEHKPNALIFTMVHLFSITSIRHSKKVVLFFSLILLLSAYGMTLVTTETTPTRYFKKDSYVNIASEKMGQLFNGTFVFDIIIDSGAKNGAKDPDFLQFVQTFQNTLATQQTKEKYYILDSFSFTDFLKRMHKAMNRDDHSFYKIPGHKASIEEYLEIFSGKDEDSDGRADIFETVVDKEFRRVNIITRMGSYQGSEIGTAQIRKSRDYMVSLLRNQANPNNYQFAVVGTPVDFMTLSGYIVTGQVQAIVLSLLIVGLIVFLLFQNIAAGFVALIPISAAILLVFGIMGLSGIPLDIAQAIISSVAIGIGVDDTIHFLNTLRHQTRGGQTLDESLQTTHRLSGLAIVYTSIALIFGFSVLVFSSFKPVLYFGLLVSSVMAATTIGALVILPAVIHSLNLRLDRKIDHPWLKKVNLTKYLE